MADKKDKNKGDNVPLHNPKTTRGVRGGLRPPAKKKVVKQKQKQKQTQQQTVNIHLGAKTVRRSSATKAPSAQKQTQAMPAYIPIYTPSPASAPTIIYADKTPAQPMVAPREPVAEKPFFTLADVPGDLFNLKMDDSVSQYGKTPKFSEKKTVSKTPISEKAPSMISKPSTYVSSIIEPPTYVSSKISNKMPSVISKASTVSSLTEPPTYVSSKAPTYTTAKMEPSVVSKAPSTGTYGLGELFYEPSVASKAPSTGTYGLGELFYEPSVVSKAPSTGTYGLGELFYEPSVVSKAPSVASKAPSVASTATTVITKTPTFISETPTKLTYTTALETPVPEQLLAELKPQKSKGGRPVGSGDPEKQRLINWYVNIAKLGTEKTAKKMSKNELVKRERDYKEGQAQTFYTRYGNIREEKQPDIRDYYT